VKAQKGNLTKRAIEIQMWPDFLKLEYFKKFEMINIKTYKCRNKQNLSPLANQDYDPKAMVRDTSELYEPRLKAFNALSKHLNQIESVSAQWLHDRSINAL